MHPGLQHFGVEGHVGAPGWGLRRMTSINYSHELAQTKQVD
jgi:hypothetical protein